jgi:Fe-S cluster assembly iron-binding protein IscA
MALDESVHEGRDYVDEIEGVPIVYDKKITLQLSNKVIDFHEGPRGGFSISGGDSCSECCDSCS